VTFYLIHQAGKVASQTLAWTIVSADRSSRVERHHYLEPSNLAEVDRLCNEAPPSAQVQSLRKQTQEARNAIAALSRQDPQDVWVLTGFRDPMDFAISAFFQNLYYYCPSYVSPAPGEAYDLDRFDQQVDSVIEVFNSEVEAYIGRVRNGLGVRDVRELDLRRKLQNLGEWFDKEFKPLYGIDVFTIEVGNMPFIRFSASNVNFLIYRMETFHEFAESILRELPLPPGCRLVNENLSSTKDYAVLYSRFRERFVPSEEMIRYYYDDRFFTHFYKGTRPRYGAHSFRSGV
jgi:hypothetical protein